MRLHSIQNCRAWMKLRLYLRDVKGKYTSWLMQVGFFFLVPFLVWSVIDLFLDFLLEACLPVRLSACPPAWMDRWVDG